MYMVYSTVPIAHHRMLFLPSLSIFPFILLSFFFRFAGYGHRYSIVDWLSGDRRR